MLSFLQIYFLINIIYTIIIMIFFDKILVDIFFKKKVPTNHISGMLNTSYIILILIGTFCLISDIIVLLINPRRCIWLYRVYEDKDQ